MYARNARVVMDFGDAELREVRAILRLAKDAPPSAKAAPLWLGARSHTATPAAAKSGITMVGADDHGMEAAAAPPHFWSARSTT